MKSDIKKVAIIGVGVMGGSLALALREKFSFLSVWGYARSQESYDKLKNLNILHKVERDLKEVVKDADLVVLALPIFAIIEYLEAITPFIKEGAIVFDLGSTKELITRYAKKRLPRGVKFVGCHPLCGSEKSGAEFSRPDLYKGEICLITSSPRSKETQVVKKLWEGLGSGVIFISPSLHDKILSSVSHMPHLVSFSLTQCVNKNYLKFSSTSLRDLTRISSSPASVWADIFFSNKKNILEDIERYIAVLERFKELVKNEDKQGVVRLIAKANEKQKMLLEAA